MLRISISHGNSKLGSIPSISLLPGLSCGAVPCITDCYAKRMMNYRPKTHQAWSRNYFMAIHHRNYYFCQIDEYLTANMPQYFRWHVAGDILDVEYLTSMRKLAIDHPDTKFMAFTKRYEFFDGVDDGISNLNIIMSMWPGLAAPYHTHCYKRAWVIGEVNGMTDLRIPQWVELCPGNCENCHDCWESSLDVAFHKH